MDTGEGIMARPSERHPPMTLEIDHSLVVAYRRQAATRNVSIQRLVTELLDVIARDGLTAAVLDADTVPDDGDPPCAGKGIGSHCRSQPDQLKRFSIVSTT
jgi:hypothetical protein